MAMSSRKFVNPLGFSNGYGRVRVVPAAAVRPELLDGDLRCDRAAGDRLVPALERGRRGVTVERLRHALADEHDPEDHCERQQDVDERPVEVAPEVPDAAGRASCESSDHRGQHRHADGRRDEVLHGQPRHLRQVGHRVLAAVELPVGVGDEARGGVQRDGRRDARQVVRVQRQMPLRAQEQVQEHREDDGEDERRACVLLPVLLMLRIGADEAKEPALTDCQSAVDEAELAFVDARHIDAERIRKSRQDDGVEDQLCGTLERH